MPAAAPDDRRHSLLRRAHALSQASLEAFVSQEAERASRLPRGGFGHYEVLEVESKSALTPCRMPGEPWSLNPYVGCSHDCGYCYVPDVAHVERPRWGSYVVVKRNLPLLLARELRRKERREVFLSSATDPYQPVERTHRVTRRCLELLARHDWPVRVLTRNPLVRRDVELLGRFSDVRVGMSVPTLDDAMRRLVEPGAPPVEGRLRALRALADAGLRPYVSLAPAYPWTGGVTARAFARALAEAGVDVVYAAGWRYVPSIAPVVRARLPESAREAFEAFLHDPGAQRRLVEDLGRALRDAGVRFVGSPDAGSRTPEAT